MQIEFNDITNFSSLFIDFINNDERIKQFFPSNYYNYREELFDLRLNQTKHFKKFYKQLINDSARLELTQKQRQNYELIEESNTLFVITGQQPGILGGPLYSLYKAISAISYCQQYKQNYPQFNFIPVYWVEESDDDVDEVNKYAFIDSSYEIHNLKLDNIKKRKLSHFDINNSIDNIIQLIFNSKSEDNELLETLKKIAENNSLLADNFINSINEFTRDYGLLFVKSSEVYKRKFYNEIIIEDLLNPGRISSIIEKNNSQLIENNYLVQAAPSDINFFCSRDDRRHKIIFTEDSYNFNARNFSKNELVDVIQNSDSIFTPKVLLRPIIQDYLFPTAAYIGGPGEIAYLAQLSKLYEHFNLNMPIVEARHSFTIINNFIIRNLDKENIDLISMIKDFKLIESEFVSNLIDNDIENGFTKIEMEIKSLYSEISPMILEIDKSLTTNIDMSVNKSIELMLNLKKKVMSQIKKKNDTRFARLSKINKYLYPNNNLQERELNIFNLVMTNNKKLIINKLLEISTQKSDHHFVINIDSYSE